MKKRRNCRNGEEGFVLVAALLIMLVLTVVGIAVNRNTTIESQIAINDRLHKEAFYMADAATELASEVLEQSVACVGIQSSNLAQQRETIVPGYGGVSGGYNVGVILDPDPDKQGGFWRKYSALSTIPSDADRDLVYPAVPDSTGTKIDVTKTNSQPHANINITGSTGLGKGVAIQMAAGYEGLGKGLGASGTILYDIKVRQMGRNGSQAAVCIQYGHRIGSEGSCNYP